ncbi:hypothetical protein GEMRC1_009573 [Eukaryota sp. GEM-RC1]
MIRLCILALLSLTIIQAFAHYPYPPQHGYKGYPSHGFKGRHRSHCIPGCQSQVFRIDEGDNQVVPQEVDLLVGCADPLTMTVDVTVGDVSPPTNVTALPDVMLAIDLTESFEPVLPAIQQLIINAADIVLDQFPDLRFGISGYMDKLHQPFGAPTDTTFELYSPLTNNQAQWEAAINALVTGSGGDIPEAQLTVMKHISRNAVDFGFLPLNNNARTRVMIVVTDASFHEGPACQLFQSNIVCTMDNQCGPDINPEEDYPTVDQVREALTTAQIEPLF